MATKKTITKNPPAVTIRFLRTKASIGKIKQSAVRRDFANMAAGIEYYLARGDKKQAKTCLRALALMAFGMNESLSPKVAIGILDGLLEDGKADALMRNGGGLVGTHSDMRCILGKGASAGSCASAKDVTCYTISGAEGCGSLSGFQMPWGLATT